MSTCTLRFLALALVLSAACRGNPSMEAADGGPGLAVVDASSVGCDAIDCGPDSVCDDSLGQPFCSCPNGTCGGGAQCIVEAGFSLCGCSDGSLYDGSSCPAAGRCPAGMSWISPSTCIDDLEFSVNDFLIFLNGLGSACDDPGPTCTACNGQRCFPSEAVNPWDYDTQDQTWSVEGQTALSLNHPARYITFDAARTACQSNGKRLCGADEWERSCGGLSNRNYPYGNEFEEGRCREGGNFGGRPWERGENADCASVEHSALRDQSGNVWEWTDSCNGNTCYVRGGSYAVDASFFPDALGCFFDQGHERGSAEFDIGFRCCDDPL